MPETIVDLGKRVKAKYPGQYDDMSDQDVGAKVKAKYPTEYADFTDVNSQFSDVQSGGSTNAGTKLTDINWNTPTDPAMSARLSELAPNAHVDVLKGLFGVPQDTTALANAKPPGLAESLLNSPVNPAFVPQQLYQAVKGIGGSIVNAPSNLGSGDPYKIGQGLAGVLSAVPVADAASSGLGALKDALIPSKDAASGKFQQVMAKAKDIPLNLAEADDAALRAQELAGRGGLPGRGSSLPKVMRDYLRTRETSPEMTYEVGRDFASSAGRLSSAEAQNVNPVMKSQVSQLAKALSSANREAAVKAGVGDLYDAAMAEYRRAMQVQTAKDALTDALKSHGVKAAIGAGLGYGVYRALEGR